MTQETQNFGDKAEVSLATSADGQATVGMEGFYRVECHDKAGNLKWEENFPNVVNAIGKQLMLNTLLNGSAYTVTGPFIGLINGAAATYSAADTMASHAGWTEFIAYTVGGSAIRGTATFASASSSGTTPSNVTTATASPIVHTITGAGGTVGGCFLVLGTGAVSTLNSTAGTLYSSGNFTIPKATTAGDTISVTYSTTATS